MNSGKICVSICAETADEMIERIKQAEDFADVIEVRFDCLEKAELENLDRRVGSPIGSSNRIIDSTALPIVSTFRPKSQGGCRELTLEERSDFWNGGFETEYCDVEEEFLEDSWLLHCGRRICSYHDFSGTPRDVAGIFERLSNAASERIGAGLEIVKVAAFANDVSDTIPILKLLKQSKRKGTRVIPIAMGEAGKWTRILGLAHGAYMTYASYADGLETAEGQISARDLRDVYRVKELDLDTKVYGVIGDPVSESLSPYIHNPAFADLGVNAVFVPFQVKNLDEFMRRMVKPETREVELNFAGFAVTMPHKQAIIKHLHAIDPTAEKIGAVNTIKIDDGKLTGYNTDAYGFITPLKEKFGDLKDARVAVFGAGGAARACVFALKRENANVSVFARNIRKANVFADEFDVAISEISNFKSHISKSVLDNFDIIVNATPIGMKGQLENKMPLTANDLKGVKFVYDLVTSAADTPLTTAAKEANIPVTGGLEMLLHQGAQQFEIWTGQPAPLEKIKEAVLKRINRT